MAELAAGALLSSLFTTLFDKLASRDLRSFFRGLKVNEGLLRNLKIVLLSANHVLDDADLKQLTDPDVRKWLFELKDTIWEAEDVLGEIDYRALQYEQRGKPRSKPLSKRFQSCLNCFSTFDEPMERKIEEIRGRLQCIVDQKGALGLQQGGTSRLPQRLLAPLADESCVYGRDDDKKKIMELLLSDNGSSSDKISVIPITGMGGIGKTTLAQLVYDERSVKSQFPISSWVTVSDDSTSSQIAKRILDGITPGKCQIEDPNQLQRAVKEALSDKRFLLVLDDVWDESYPHLEPLMSCFHYGARGSWIIVTTRSDKVADKMRNLPTYHLKTVSDDECWKLFADRAFKNASSETYRELQAIGRDIVKKCKGVPLAVKSLAGLLGLVLDPKEWNEVLNSDIWELQLQENQSNNILPSLWLSYHYLPSHLKRCFAYCSMFPKDYEMNELRKKEVILLWMAEGLVQPEIRGKQLEDIGNDYFQDLISRSLFQPLGKDKSTILMHDLIHDLAMFVSGEFSIRLDDNAKAKFSSKTRHFSYSKIEDYENFDEVLSDAKSIRSFLQFPSHYYHCESPGRVSLLKTLLRVGGCLRALCLSQFGFTVLPDSIGNLKYLRYLDLSANSDLEEIPNTLCDLYNLQTLRLSRCRRLTQLPADMGNLVNLRHLYIEQVPLKKMPPKMRNLKALQTLGKFVIGENGGSSIEELGWLRFLSGALKITGLQNVDGIENVRGSYLKDKKFLTKLACCWSNNDHSDDSRKDKEVLDALQPHSNLRELIIDGYGVETLPSWLGHCSYEAMVSVRLTNCCNCRVLPPLGQLPSLQELYIYRCRGVERIGAEFFYSIKPFRSLKRLKFEDLSEWQEWSFPESRDGGCFPSLEHLSIQDCPRLEILRNEQIAILPGSQQMEMSFPRLDQLRIEKCPKLETFLLSNFPSNLKVAYISGSTLIIGDSRIPNPSLIILGCKNVMTFPEALHPTTLTCLHVTSLDNLKALNGEGFHHFPCLEQLIISFCEELQRFPGEGLHVSLTSLYLTTLPKLEDLGKGLQHLISLKELNIKRCGNLQYLSENGLPTSLTSLYLDELPKLEDLGEGGLQHLTSLKELDIRNCGNLKCLSENGLPTSLTSLHLEELPKLEDLGKGGLQHLISLKELGIQNCRNLQCLFENGLPTSLTSLIISDLPSLEDLGKNFFQHHIYLEKLSIYDCKNLKYDSQEEENVKGGLKNFISLKDLTICHSEKLLGLLEKGLPPSLTSLWINGFQNLRDLNRMGFQHLISLSGLKIWNCANLQCLPEQGLPSSLSLLDIRSCPLLEPRCQKGTGSDWPKISDISRVYIY